ncbi:GbsR/MarR family transcriptional regulator [Martelella alba]|uniref:HTH-type transcriptional regulator n=1 Tax=Martelella alba TaxID=2590451 RepID=A0A506UGM3_9HYPH|nr:GbsR/MarR family transcriptional regulator [Martelella alba]TPW32299.1 GbsR/MarR family transcriptional regulator [Martelella alba]
MILSPMAQDFVLHFGEMGSRWGISRTVGQIYALLYIAPEPVCADGIVEALKMSRSNVSMGLKELQSWGLLNLRHVPGDRRDYFTTPEDVWAILRILAEERKRREIDPTLSVLRDILQREPEDEADSYAQTRMHEMHALIEQLTGWYDDIKTLETERLKTLLTLGSKVTKLLETKDRIMTLGKPPKGEKGKVA